MDHQLSHYFQKKCQPMQGPNHMMSSNKRRKLDVNQGTQSKSWNRRSPQDYKLLTSVCSVECCCSAKEVA